MSDTRAEITVREACRRRMALDGADAQALEHALTMTELELAEALELLAGQVSEVARLRGLLGECEWIGNTCDVIGMSDTRLNAARVLQRRLAAALKEKDHG